MIPVASASNEQTCTALKRSLLNPRSKQTQARFTNTLKTLLLVITEAKILQDMGTVRTSVFLW
jgi:hypothetical protein